MTVIAGFRKDGKIALAAESQSTWRDMPIRTANKIIESGESFIGSSGYSVLNQMIRRFSTEERELGAADASEIHLFMAEFVQWMNKSYGYDALAQYRADNSGHASIEGNLLVASPKGLFLVGGELSASRIDTFCAVGSASEVAVGYMACAEEWCREEDALSIATAAITATCSQSIQCGGPVRSVEVVEQ